MPIDLRSDTVTLPSAEMRRVMHEAELGDDVLGEDPSVNRLEAVAAQRLGKPAALFIPSGTMGNLLGVLVNASSHQEVIVEAQAHIFMYEGAGAATVGGVQLRPVATTSGVLSPADLEAALRPRQDDHQPVTAAVCLEDTHNRHGGACWSRSELAALRAKAQEHQVRVHLDGARLFNAAVATGLDPAEIAGYADTVTFCLSKGLGCPIGSMFCGDAAAIASARRWRKMLGGGWRQAGVLAAAGLYALEHLVERLADDHRHARTLAEGLAEVAGLELDPDRVMTNIVIVRVASQSAEEFAGRCRERGLLVGVTDPDRVRFVTHFGVDAEAIQKALAIAAEAAA